MNIMYLLFNFSFQYPRMEQLVVECGTGKCAKTQSIYKLSCLWNTSL